MVIKTDDVIDLYFSQPNVIVQHQIDSFNHYMDEIIPDILQQFYPISLDFNNEECLIKKVVLNISNLHIDKPTSVENDGCSELMTPNIARKKNSSYLASLVADFTSSITIQDGKSLVELDQKVIPNIIIGKVPIMTKSKYCILSHKGSEQECNFDVGGYFIINGNEKVIICQEKIANNIIQIFKNQKGSSKYGYICEIRSLRDDIFGVPKTISLKYTNRSDMFDNHIRILLPHMKKEIPIFILFRALGCERDETIVNYILDNDGSDIDNTILKILKPSIEESSEVQTEMEAITFISKHMNNNYYYVQNEDKKIQYIKQNILKEYLNHLGDEPLKKVFFTGFMINKLLKCSLGILKLDDRDSFVNKRIETTGNLMGSLTMQCFNKMNKDIKNQITKEVNSGIWNLNDNWADLINEINIHKLIKPTYLENTLKGAMATGNWGMKVNVARQGFRKF